ncbi:MAG TPA: AMP-binding protein [Steroidobacteraceae bacterium]|nr:AMP-binding protein [Steroidobacteraceae bacterium]
MTWFGTPEPLLPDFFVLNARFRGADTAVMDCERRLSWHEFEAATARAANGMTALGLHPGDRVALLMDNSLEMAVAMFGIVRAGCVAVPLNVSISDEAVAGMIKDAAARAVFASSRHCPRIDALATRSASVAAAVRVGLETTSTEWITFDTWLGAQSESISGPDIAPEQECNIIYSSGTTGVPKGIVHSHRCRMHWAYDTAVALRYRSGCVTLCSLGLFSNITWVAMLSTIVVGGTLVIMRSFDPVAALELVESEHITHGSFVPLQLERLLGVPDVEQRDLSSLETLMCCGSPLPLAVKRAFPERFGCQLIELYGLTEGLCTTLAPEDFAAKTDSVGKPFPGTDLRIIGEDDVELPIGEVGEIVGLGRIIMAGYHNRPEASAEATWTDPAGRRWLRTGDLGRLDEEGFLYVVDRKKDMILSGGQNVYPADIEAVMLQHPLVAEVAVIAAASRKWGETPVAVVVLKSEGALERDALIEWTNARLGKQQRISDVLWYTSLPRNANGKVLKRELRQAVAQLTY